MIAKRMFSLELPESTGEAVLLLRGSENPVVMAGGQSLTVLLKKGFANPDVVVSLAHCSELFSVQHVENTTRIGAMVTTRSIELDRTLGRAIPVLGKAASRVASPHVRNFGTVVGNICHADPGSDVIVALMCLDAYVQVSSVDGMRTLEVQDLVLGPYTTSLRQAELATELIIKHPSPTSSAGYRKLVLRAGDLAMGSAAVVLEILRKEITQARIAVGGALPRPIRLKGLETLMEGRSTVELAALGGRFDVRDTDDIELMHDPHISSDSQFRILSQLVADALNEATGDAETIDRS